MEKSYKLPTTCTCELEHRFCDYCKAYETGHEQTSGTEPQEDN